MKIFVVVAFYKLEHWRNKVDRACIERIRAFQNPPFLVGQIMEMITVMIGKRKISDIASSKNMAAAEQQKAEPSKERDNNKTEQESGGGKVAATTKKAGANKMERLDKVQWKAYQNMMQDAGKFVDMMHSVDWEDGLQAEVAIGK